MPCLALLLLQNRLDVALSLLRIILTGYWILEILVYCLLFAERPERTSSGSCLARTKTPFLLSFDPQEQQDQVLFQVWVPSVKTRATLSQERFFA